MCYWANLHFLVIYVIVNGFLLHFSRGHTRTLKLLHHNDCVWQPQWATIGLVVQAATVDSMEVFGSVNTQLTTQLF